MNRDLLYLHEHTSCRHYVSDYRSRFRNIKLESGATQQLEGESYNFIDFIIEGEFIVTYNEFENRKLAAGQMIFIPKGCLYSSEALSKGTILRFTFDAIYNVCDRMNLRSYWPLCAKMEHDFQPLQIRPQLQNFIDSLTYYLSEGVNCEHYHEIKQTEIFLILRWFYTKEELARLFYPIIGKSIDFKALVLENYLKVDCVPELAALSHMGRSNFDATFKKEFGMPAGQWMLKQTAMHVKHHLSEPNATISDVMIKFHFNSPTHFTRFCKQQFGCTPTELMAKIKEI